MNNETIMAILAQVGEQAAEAARRAAIAEIQVATFVLRGGLAAMGYELAAVGGGIALYKCVALWEDSLFGVSPYEGLTYCSEQSAEDKDAWERACVLFQEWKNNQEVIG